ncbi:MAG: hypothetical protein GX640_20755, partial [Fibrobacter sp.]|nr:hypothetical protein [Fibrobacter sp.]
GETTDPVIIKLRERQKRNFLSTLILAQGVPMILAGDEFGRTQHGNNNAYCQDNKISWINWNFDSKSHNLLQFTRFLLKFFHSHPILQRRRFFNGRNTRQSGIKDLTWFHPDGKEMTEGDWNNPQIRYLGLRLAGDAIEEVDEHGEQIIDDTLLILLNGHFEPVTFLLPECLKDEKWELVFSTVDEVPNIFPVLYDGNSSYEMESRSLSLFRLPISSVSGPEKSINIMENALRILRRAERSISIKSRRNKIK